VNFDSASQIAGHQLLESWGSLSREQCQLGKTRSTYRSPGVGAGTATPESALHNASHPSERSCPEGAVTVGSGALASTREGLSVTRRPWFWRSEWPLHDYWLRRRWRCRIAAGPRNTGMECRRRWETGEGTDYFSVRHNEPMAEHLQDGTSRASCALGTSPRKLV
jgi:hypothetical protein